MATNALTTPIYSLYIANRDDEHPYCKHNGSLEDGFELVSHPMTLAHHTEHINWDYARNIKLRKAMYKDHEQ